MDWKMLDPRMTLEVLGFVPDFLDEGDPRPARWQFAAKYVGGWFPIPLISVDSDGTLHYPGDPPMAPLAETMLRDEKIRFYRHALVSIEGPDGVFEVSRLD